MLAAAICYLQQSQLCRAATYYLQISTPGAHVFMNRCTDYRIHRGEIVQSSNPPAAPPTRRELVSHSPGASCPQLSPSYGMTAPRNHTTNSEGVPPDSARCLLFSQQEAAVALSQSF
ncbi:hypothetical protein NDU88_003209 [Pleurodeles waltl]|uniref:Uncharacterized protein n=1 Tax=Pleurodeles waltl TaxID=8319 RepID=A0AAV7PHI6_PLEWA|nr:hypothetical protein NDU88_003209 [Pleurodeles waltl]